MDEYDRYKIDYDQIWSALNNKNHEALKELLTEDHIFNYGDDAVCYQMVHRAIHEGDYHSFKIFLDAAKRGMTNEEMLDSSFRCASLLHLACKQKSWKILSDLADVFEDGTAEETEFILHYACFESDIECIRVLLKKFPRHLNQMDISGSFPIHYVARHDSNDSLRALINAGVDINAHTEIQGQTVLHQLAAFNSGGLEKVETVLKHGGNVNARDTKGRTPLYTAAECNNFEMVRILLRFGGDPSVKCFENYTPLSIAAFKGGHESVKTLVEATPAEFRPDAILQASLAGSSEILNYLFSKGFQTFVSSEYRDEDNPWNGILFKSNPSYRPSTVKILLEQGTQFRELANRGEMLLMPNKLHIIDREVLKLFLDFGLAELRCVDADLSNLVSIVNTVSHIGREVLENARRIFFDYELLSLEEMRSNLHSNMIEYLKHIPFISLSEDSNVPSDDFNFHFVPAVPTLTDLCRWTVRCCIVREHGSVTPNLIGELILPRTVQNFICYK